MLILGAKREVVADADLEDPCPDGLPPQDTDAEVAPVEVKYIVDVVVKDADVIPDTADAGLETADTETECIGTEDAGVENAVGK
ncbi:hypothetical protein N7533_008116 [Penicillium manginii]|uniref:uncharacterized protein n=1 Tax=Penicillium manginii TaxID=203109 RepID=UPI0025499199|nr:uncharacterized protein N7533_008116 [Penicillium manginii]KAJ5751088.1 hypothetical protein N7533_008116 [Penicillium manginii]